PHQAPHPRRHDAEAELFVRKAPARTGEEKKEGSEGGGEAPGFHASARGRETRRAASTVGGGRPAAASPYAPSAWRGRSMLKTQPWPGRSRAASRPWLASTLRREMDRPRPSPLRSSPRCSYGANKASASPSGRPPHSSLTSIRIRSAAA